MKNLTSFMRRAHQRALFYVATVFFGVLSYAPCALADGDEDVASKVTEPMNALVNVLTSVMAVVGVLMLIKSVTELVNAIQESDNSGMFRAGRGMVAALLMISIKFVIKLFGV